MGGALADHLQRVGHDVSLAQTGERGKSIERAVARNPALKVQAAADAVRGAEVVFLATPFQANESALAGVAGELAGKVLVDCTNPVGPGLTHGLKSEPSGASFVASLVPGAKVVKAFSAYGFENFEDSAYPGYNVEPAMFFCGDDAAAKATVAQLIAALGWAPLDVGGLEQALHLEHMTLMWVRMVRAKGGSPHVVWAALRRTAGSATT